MFSFLAILAAIFFGFNHHWGVAVFCVLLALIAFDWELVGIKGV